MELLQDVGRLRLVILPVQGAIILPDAAGITEKKVQITR